MAGRDGTGQARTGLARALTAAAPSRPGPAPQRQAAHRTAPRRRAAPEAAPGPAQRREPRPGRAQPPHRPSPPPPPLWARGRPPLPAAGTPLPVAGRGGWNAARRLRRGNGRGGAMEAVDTAFPRSARGALKIARLVGTAPPAPRPLSRPGRRLAAPSALAGGGGCSLRLFRRLPLPRSVHGAGGDGSPHHAAVFPAVPAEAGQEAHLALLASGREWGGAGRPFAALYGALRFSSPVEAGGRFAVTLMSSHLFSSSFNLPVVLVYVSVAEFHKFH